MSASRNFTSFLDSNLAALHAWNPWLVERLRAVGDQPCPDPTDPAASCSWQLTTGRDGTLTYARRISSPAVGGGAPEIAIQWLGGTSMPASSAVPLAANLEPGTHNGLGIGIGTGYEWRTLAARLASYQMIFVLEDDLATLRRVLEICDLSEVLQRGKIILLGGPESEAQLQHVLRAHPGIVPPDVMHPLPTLSPERRNELLAIGERIIRAAINAQAPVALAAQQALDQAWSAAPSESAGHGESRRIMGLLFARSHRFDRVSPELLAAAAQAGQQVTTLQVDHHTSASLLYRAQQVAACKPDLLLGDLFRAQMEIGTSGESGGGLAKVPVYTLLPPAARAGTWDPARMVWVHTLAPIDRVICHDDATRRKLQAAGFATGQIILLPLAVTPSGRPGTALAATPSQTGTVTVTAAGLNLRHRVALLGEIFATDPETYGLVLPTHQAVWQAATQIITEEFARLHPGLISDVLRRAQQRCGVDLRDPVLTESLERGIRDILLATLTVRALAQNLTQAGMALQLLGSGWSVPNTSNEKTPSPLPAGAQTLPYDAPDAWNQVAVVVHFTADGHVPPALLEAPFSGVPIVCLQSPAADWPGGLSTLFEPGKHYVTSSLTRLVPTLRGLLRDAPRRAALAAGAAEHLSQYHTWEKRLAELLAAPHILNLSRDR